MSFNNCTSVSIDCLIKATTYGYRPSLGPIAALLAVFIIALLSQLIFVLRYRLWSYSLGLASGCVFEVVDYIGRLQIVCLTFVPSFIAAGIYVTVTQTPGYLLGVTTLQGSHQYFIPGFD
jgi:hypothetical protein